MAHRLSLVILLMALTAFACSSAADPSPTATVTTEPTPTVTPEATTVPDATATAESTVSATDACSFETSTPLVFRSVVQVISEGHVGTGFAIGGGEFVTAAHVVSEGGPISLRSSSAEAEATIVGLELDTDIAILRSDFDAAEPVSFGELDDLAAGQSVAVAGYPGYVEDDPSVVSGLLSKIVEDPDLGFGTFLQTDAAVNPGNSGGPIFNRCGDVIGMIVAKVVDTSIEGISWAVAENTLQSALPRVRRKGPPQPDAAVEAWYREVDAAPRYISNTGGRGVSLRDDCLDSARIDGSWPEGAPVVLSHEGVGFCAGWSIVANEEAASWVRNDYLAASPPGSGQAASPPASGSRPLSRQEAVSYLNQVYDDAIAFSSRLTNIIAQQNDDEITTATAATRSYALQNEAGAYADQVLLDSNSLATVSNSCEQARLWLGDAIFYTGLSAGYGGLGYEFWPDYSFDEADEMSDNAFAALGLALDEIEACATGR